MAQLEDIPNRICTPAFLNMWTFRGALRASSTLKKRETAQETRRVIERIEATLGEIPITKGLE